MLRPGDHAARLLDGATVDIAERLRAEELAALASLTGKAVAFEMHEMLVATGILVRG